MATEAMRSSALSSAVRSSLRASANRPLLRLPSPPLATAAASSLTKLALRSARRFPPTVAAASSSSPDNQAAVVVLQPEAEDYSAEDVVRRFYGGINGPDLSSVEGLIADDCIYEDLIFPRPFVGRKAILDFFGKFLSTISADLQFVIDDISSEDSSAVGVTWHLEWKGKSFPFSKGCSFYRLQITQGRRQITYGRDIVEPAIKPGEAALVVIRGVIWLLEKFPQLEKQL